MLARLIKIALILSIFVFVLMFPFHMFPSDSEMENLLVEHKAEFAELVHLAQEEMRTRATPEPDYSAHLDPRALAVMSELGLKYVQPSSLWLDDPYEPKYMSRISEAIHDPNASRFYSVILEPVGGSHRSASYWRLVKKFYFYVPQTPRINEGWFMGTPDYQGNIAKAYKVKESLDWYWWVLATWPSEPVYMNCVIRATSDSHWFIKLCQSKH